MFGVVGTGGANNLGTIFKIKPDGTNYAKLLDFAGAANGSNPQGAFISVGALLYGTTGAVSVESWEGSSSTLPVLRFSDADEKPTAVVIGESRH